MNRAFKGIWIPKEVWLNEELSVMEKLFLVEIDSLDNEKGCFASNKHFADFFGISKGRCSQIINRLYEKNLIEVTFEYEGKEVKKRTIKVVNKLNTLVNKLNHPIKNSKHPYLENDEVNNTSINNTNNNNTNSNAHLENEIESDFEEWWNLYDKKLDKKKSLIVFKKCHKEHGYEKILEGTKAYLQTVTDKQYQRYPTTFLNNQSYLDIDEFKNIAKQKMSKLRGNDGIDLNSQYEKDLTEHLGF